MAISNSVFPLTRAANNIVRINRSTGVMQNTQTSFSEFLSFMSGQTQTLKSIQFDKKKLRKLQSINPISTFGRPGNLLSGLASGALDAASAVGNFFGGGKKPASSKAGQPIPKGQKVRFSGMRALGIANVALAGLDFAQGLQEGEGVGKAAAGAGGNLAGSLIGGAIGQALVPIPGLGFVLGSMAGGMLGGYLGDRAYETGEKIVGQGQLKQQEAEQKAAARAISSSQNTWPSTLDRFEKVISNFEKAVAGGMLGASSPGTSSQEASEETGMHDEEPKANQGAPPENIEDNEYSVSGGQLPSKYINTKDWHEFRQYYNSGRGGYHQGEDLPIAQGTPISMVIPGKVAQAGFTAGGAGGNVLITHEDGKQTRYLHMSAIYVKPGDTVSSGKVIGLTGGQPGTKGAGHSYGPHLHYEFYKSTSSGPDDPHPTIDRYFRFGGRVTAKKKVTSQTGVMGTAGKPTAVLMAGTNDYGNAKGGAAGVKQAIKNLQEKGYNVVVVPPSEVGQTAEVSKQIQQVAAEMGATVRKGQYKPKDDSGAIGYAHLTQASADAIARDYKGATFVGDSNATMIPGAKIAATSQSASTIAGMINKEISPAGPAVKPQSQIQSVPQQTTTPQQMKPVQQYPTYNLQQNKTVVLPIVQGSGKQTPRVISSPSSGQKTVLMPGPSELQVLNSLYKTMLLTQLSSS